MTILENPEDSLAKLWALIQELSDQLNQNRDVSASIYQQAGGIKKTQAIHAQTGFVLRRFNLDKPKELYDAELERMNASMTAENIALQHDNKQLNALIREYEQTLETLMNTFRNRAKDVQERELALSREYESQLLARQEECDTEDLNSSTVVYTSLMRISHVLRQLLRAHGGEPLEPDPPTLETEAGQSRQLSVEEREPWTTLAAREPWTSLDATGADYAMEREIELSRLEKENEELRQMLSSTLPPQANGSHHTPSRRQVGQQQPSHLRQPLEM
ncbi:hypothetical protein MIND_00860600 [Mycena indigotica]|uniref:Uncharacterized protein n=1 Tax=Mycena indigotica TaxID=2126181 RepID=A0A8H6SHT4_9AGAR|nr:uncharacterized protein MIND_00860600 [Mycena indigotica]KAF7299122.1 hypothetical protein MIND_00860600 [Mycena indigotica]